MAGDEKGREERVKRVEMGRTLGISGSSIYILVQQLRARAVKTVADGIISLFIERSAHICDPDRHARHVASILVRARHALLCLRITFTIMGKIAVRERGVRGRRRQLRPHVSRCGKGEHSYNVARQSGPWDDRTGRYNDLELDVI